MFLTVLILIHLTILDATLIPVTQTFTSTTVNVTPVLILMLLVTHALNKDFVYLVLLASPNLMAIPVSSLLPYAKLPAHMISQYAFCAIQITSGTLR